MPDERTSPSAGWREVYAEMEASTDIEPADCPDCGRESPHIYHAVYHCRRHGYWRVAAD